VEAAFKEITLEVGVEASLNSDLSF
jgi:hypothetical protein